MSTLREASADEAEIVMSRVYDAPRALVWQAMTEARHVARWWGGPGFSNPVCDMDVRPGGLWRHVMRFPDGHELKMQFVFLDVEKPARLVWQHAGHGTRNDGPPASRITVTLEDLGGNRTRWRMVARFASPADRDVAIAMGFIKPIEASNNRLAAYLPGLIGQEQPS